MGTFRLRAWRTSMIRRSASLIVSRLFLPLTATYSFPLRSAATRAECIALSANYPDGFDHPWQVITLTPIDDFVGTLKATNRLMMIIIIGLSCIELFFIYFSAT